MARFGQERWQERAVAPPWERMVNGLRWVLIVALFGVLVLVMMRWLPPQIRAHMATLWLEQAHYQLLHALATARERAIHTGRPVSVCAATTRADCLDSAAPGAQHTSWRLYQAPPASSLFGRQTRPWQQQFTFNAEQVRVRMGESGSSAAKWGDLGFDGEGYSLESRTRIWELTAIEGHSGKRYRVLLEPSGLVQTRVFSTP
jgi:Tfp pilus assembly protein FimT